MSPSSTSTLADDASLVRTIAGYFEAVGKQAVARGVRASLEAPQHPTTVALVGEVGRGKTLLADALQRFYAVVDSNPAYCRDNERVSDTEENYSGSAGIRPSGAFDNFAYIDCPGFNGAESEVTQAAISLTRDAGVVVFVLDATTTITSPELELLKEIALGSRGLVVALAKKDKNLLGWRVVEETNRRQIERHIGDAIPVVSVSALRFLSVADEFSGAVTGGNSHTDSADSVEVSPGSLAEAVVTDSGIPRLAEALNQCRVQQSVEHSEAQIRPTLARALPLLSAELAEVRTIAKSDSQHSVTVLNRRKQELEQLVAERRRGQQLLTSGLNQARSRATSMSDDDLARARQRWHDYFEMTPPRFIRAHSDAVFLQIEAEFSAIFEQAIRRLMVLSREAYGSVAVGVVDWRAIVDALADLAFDVDASDAPPDNKSVAKLVDPSLVSLTIAGGFSLTHVIGMVPGIGALVVGSGGTALPFVAMASVWLGVNMYHRSKKISRGELNKWLDQLVLQTRRQVSHAIETVYNELRPLVVNQFHDSMENQINRAKLELQLVKAGKSHSEKEQEEAFKEAQQKASYLLKLIEQTRKRTEPHA